MPHKAIEDIIAVEKEIQTQLENERDKAAQWLRRQKEALEQEYHNNIEKLEAETSAKHEAVNRAAIAEANQIVKQATQEAQQLTNIDHAILWPIVLRHITCIDPRKAP